MNWISLLVVVMVYR